jgi:hypothetical protein
MQRSDYDRSGALALVFVLVLLFVVTLTALAAQPRPLGNPGAFSRIPAPSPMVISPTVFASYGALITAVTLTTLYVYRGRAFIVYWIGGWMLLAGSLTLPAMTTSGSEAS